MYGLKHTKTQIAPQITIPQTFFRERTLRPPQLNVSPYQLKILYETLMPLFHKMFLGEV